MSTLAVYVVVYIAQRYALKKAKLRMMEHEVVAEAERITLKESQRFS
jgi:hypothetical protein